MRCEFGLSLESPLNRCNDFVPQKGDLARELDVKSQFWHGYILRIVKTWIVKKSALTRSQIIGRHFRDIKNTFWHKLGRVLRRDFINDLTLRKRMSAQMAIVVFAGTLVGVFLQAPSSQAVVVSDCSQIGQLRNGGFESPVPGTTVISASGTTYPTTSTTAAQQNSTNTVTDAVYGPLDGTNWQDLDASADGSSYRTYALSGSANDARMYWYTTDASEQIERAQWATAQAGNRFAELNAEARAAIYQDIPTVPGVTIRWSLAHRGRSGSETMHINIGKPTNSVAQVRASSSRYNLNSVNAGTALQSPSDTRTAAARAGLSLASAFPAGSSTSTTEITDGTSGWRFWYGVYEETSTTTSNTRFMFEAVTPETGSLGNMLDSISFSPVAACPITRTFNSPTAVQTVDVFDTSTGSFAIVPNESGHTESVTSLVKVDGPGTVSLNSGGRTLQFTPNGTGVTHYNYTITYSANGIASTSDGTMTFIARDVFGAPSCSVGSFDTSTTTTNGQTNVILRFITPTQANTDSDNDHQSGVCTWTVPDGVNAVDYLVVGGGGGGSSGGGGGGGVVTSWATAFGTNTSSQRTAARNPLAVTPGESINVHVGGGGKPGWGGNIRCTFTNSTANTCTTPTRVPTQGANSSFGSVTATGGGFGGGSGQSAGGDGGSGGGSRFDASASSGAASASTVIGASSFGNIGGGSTASGGYRAGGGGGGAGTAAVVSAPPSGGDGGQGGLVRDINSTGGSNGNGNVYSGSTKGGGGHGGRGVMSNIASFAGTYSEYGCGGGGGINDNSNNVISGAGGSPGCASAGTGSNFATFLTTRANSMPAIGNSCTGLNLGSDCVSGRITSTQFNGTAVPTEGFGGGGAGTDPEGDIAGSGGSGVVVIRYIVSSIFCPNSSNNTQVAGPIACPYPITITAGAAVSTNYNLSYGDSTNGYVSFPGASTDTVTVSTTIGNGTDTVTVTITNGRMASFAVSNASTLLAGATYPMRYTIFSGASSSTDYVLLRITDPSQATPVIIPVDPRATFVDLSEVKIGGSQMTQVCFTPIADNTTTGYGNLPSVDRTQDYAGETRTVWASSGALRLQGTSSNLQQATKYIRITKNASDARLLPGTTSRKIRVDVSNGTVGGNGSCNFGNSSIIELKPILLDQTILNGTVTVVKVP